MHLFIGIEAVTTVQMVCGVKIALIQWFMRSGTVPDARAGIASIYTTYTV